MPDGAQDADDGLVTGRCRRVEPELAAGAARPSMPRLTWRVSWLNSLNAADRLSAYEQWSLSNDDAIRRLRGGVEVAVGPDR